MHLRASILTLAACAALGACQARDDDTQPPEPTPEPTLSPTPTPGETVSILRPDVEAEQGLPPSLVEPLDASVGFPEGGDALDDAALEALEEVLGSAQIELGEAIILRGHSDAGGSDDANIRASQARAEAVRDWLVEEGVDEARFEIIAFGEQNPLEPNALPDGSPNEEGRAANRRVEIEVMVPEEADSPPAS